jgi:hypothetical protein
LDVAITLVAEWLLVWEKNRLEDESCAKYTSRRSGKRLGLALNRAEGRADLQLEREAKQVIVLLWMTYLSTPNPYCISLSSFTF